MNADTIRAWLMNSASAIHAQRDYLTELDAAIGDGEHGENMDRGYTAVVARMDKSADAKPGQLLISAGATLQSTVGGVSGALWGAALESAGRSLGDAADFDALDLGDALTAALTTVVDLGGAQEGEKTMVDALAPAVRRLQTELAAGADLSEALVAVSAAGEEGMLATTWMQATKGRAAYLSERTVGHQDPGATSTALIINALAETLDKDS